MQQILPIINKIQDALSLAGEDSFIDLPQLAVVGSQSSGKSSVLESIVGRDFLPRGVGIVTRCPLILQLINVKPGEGGDIEWGEFLHLPDKRFTNFLDIRREIEAETNHIVGGKGEKAISSKPINLRIHSPYVPTLTMVDLPGLTKVAIGDQPHNIDVLIRDLVIKFIANSATIILAISPANVDLANSDSLKLAREVDPNGVRTIGILTKLDLMDQGTDAMPILTGKVYPLKLGFVGVINRSQQDINANRGIQDALEREQDFFARHPVYSSIKHKCGYPYLISRLNKIFLKEIRSSLPRTIQLLQNNLRSAQEKVRSLGKPIGSENRCVLLLDVIFKFFNAYTTALDGRIPDSFQGGLYGGARLAKIFSKDLETDLDKILSKPISNQEIEYIIYNSSGINVNIYFPDSAFSFLVKSYVNSMREPIMNCLQNIYHELYNIVCDIQLPEFERFPAVRERIYSIYQYLLDSLIEPAKSMIDDVLNMEKKYINVYHPDFVRSDFFSSNKPSISSDMNDSISLPSSDKPTKPDSPPSENSPDRIVPNPLYKTTSSKPISLQKPKQDKEQKTKRPFWKRMFNQSNPPLKPGKLCPSKSTCFQVDLLKSLTSSYIDIISKNMRDRIPKILTHFLINASKEKLQVQLTEALYKDELIESLIVESSHISDERERYTRIVQMLESALSILTTTEF